MIMILMQHALLNFNIVAVINEHCWWPGYFPLLSLPNSLAKQVFKRTLITWSRPNTLGAVCKNVARFEFVNYLRPGWLLRIGGAEFSNQIMGKGAIKQNQNIWHSLKPKIISKTESLICLFARLARRCF